MTRAPSPQRPPGAGPPAVGVIGVAAAVVVAVLLRGWWAVPGAVAVLAATIGLLEVHRRSRGTVVLALAAVVGIAVGLGVGVRHLVLVGVGVAGAAGVVALGAGIVAGVAGLMGVRGPRRWPAWIAAVPLIGWFLVWPLTVALMATTAPQIPLGPDTPAEHGLGTAERATFRAADGVALAGWYVPGENGVAVVLRHGAASTRAAVLAHAAVLSRHGYGVLATDARGVGASAGDANHLGWYGDLDVTAAVDHLRSRPEVDRVAAIGLSMGGEEVLGAAAADDRVLAVVAEGASGRSVLDDDLALPDTPLRWANVGRDVLTTAMVEAISGADRPTALADAVARIAPRPVLLITGADAVGGEVLVGRRLAERFPTVVTLWEVPGGGHIAGLATDPARWEAQVVGFLDEAFGLDGA